MHWMLDANQSDVPVNASHAARLIREIGNKDRAALAAAILGITQGFMPVHHCTVFAYEASRNPRLLSGASLDNHWVTFNTATLYIRDFFRKDGILPIIRTIPYSAGNSQVLVHRQSGQDVSDIDYRVACYDHIGIIDRLAALVQVGKGQWVSTNLYRDRSDGCFTSAEVQRFLGLAPLFASCAARHYASDIDGETIYRSLISDGIDELCPQLTMREREVLLRILDGVTTERIAEDLQIRPTTVITYRTRAYEKLGVSSRRELFATVLRRQAPDEAAGHRQALELVS
ncbi:helix-turn-helix transcriptional regulator [Massilia niastensis]|uniref:helix-turn-helix transcriptional regulator n=1 Tax=Massilia niastensis TaxID=544911 RepID=UPI00036F6311|nr:helix-turn-helix transcriptional regulator [Massilia niastensis]